MTATLLAMGSCRCPSREEPPELEVSSPDEICGDPSLTRDDFCLPAQTMEDQLRFGKIEILDSHLTAQGTSKPQRLRLRLERDEAEPWLVFAKWKEAPPSGDESNNSPRREIAAYELQKILFRADDYVVPPTVLRCFPLDAQGQRLRDATAFENTRCSLGALSYWLGGVEELGEIDADRFASDAQYRRHLAALNIFTVVAAHRDSVGLNFLIASDPKRPRVFSVDNGMTFGAFAHNPLSWFSDDWLEIRVPALSGELVARFRAIERSDLDRLAVVAELAAEGDLLVPVRKLSPPLDPEAGVRRSADRLQLGLTREEIEGIYQRMQELSQRIERGEVALR